MFCNKFCCCFFPKPNIDDALAPIPLQTVPTIEGRSRAASLVKKYEKKEENEPACFDARFIRDDETEIFPFTRRAIQEHIESELADQEKFKPFFTKDNLTIATFTGGSLFTEAFQVMRMKLSIPKSFLTIEPKPSLKVIVRYINDKEKRMEWDKGLKEMVISERNDCSYILYTKMHKPIFFIAERDIVDKKIDFFDEGVYYTFSSSTSDEIYPVQEDIVRLVDYCSASKFEEDDHFYHFQAIAQMDFKMALPQSVLNFTLPTKLREWYYNLLRATEKDLLASGNDGNNE